MGRKPKHSSETVAEARRLRAENGWGWKRIGQHLGVPPETVRSWLYYEQRVNG